MDTTTRTTIGNFETITLGMDLTREMLEPTPSGHMIKHKLFMLTFDGDLDALKRANFVMELAMEGNLPSLAVMNQMLQNCLDHLSADEAVRTIAAYMKAGDRNKVGAWTYGKRKVSFMMLPTETSVFVLSIEAA